MDANQRSEVNNQTNNGANEKWTPGAKGNTTDGPMDHTYPQGANQQAAVRGEDAMQNAQDPSRMGGQQVAAEDGGGHDNQSALPGAIAQDLPGGSLQSQQTGGSGPQQGITDSHQRQMEQHSSAWGLLEQPVGRRDAHSGTDVHVEPGNRQSARGMNPQNPAHPELQGGSLGPHHGAGTMGQGTGMAMGTTVTMGQQPGQQSSQHAIEQSGNLQASTDRAGSQTGSAPRDTGSHDVHQSNDLAGGLPRSGSNSGPRTEGQEWKPGQSVKAEEKNTVHESNDVGGGLPKSPAGANQLAGDRKMDDDTGFSRG
jgi:hypothetical protein